MYVCLCNKVTDRQIRDAARRGCSRLNDLRSELGVASCCGSCGDMAQEILDEQNAYDAMVTLTLPQPA